MNDNLSGELRQALTEIEAVRRAIANDNLDRRGAHVRLGQASDIVRRAIRQTLPPATPATNAAEDAVDEIRADDPVIANLPSDRFAGEPRNWPA
jgi:hypothetical protein